MSAFESSSEVFSFWKNFDSPLFNSFNSKIAACFCLERIGPDELSISFQFQSRGNGSGVNTILKYLHFKGQMSISTTLT